MIPSIRVLAEKITERVYPGRTYKINFNSQRISTITNDSAILGTGTIGHMVLGKKESVSVETISNVDRLYGYIDDLEAVKQAIYLILSTERYRYPIYSWDYGVELVDLIGKPMPYVMSELPRRISEALTQDNRIDSVVDFKFEKNGKKLHVTFTVVSSIGNIPTELEVDV